MRVLAITFLAGVLFCQQLTFLPNSAWCWLLFITFPLCFLRSVFVIIPCGLLSGFLWAVLQGFIVLSSELPKEYESQDLTVVGVVSSLPERDENRQRFAMDVSELIYAGQSITGPKKIRLSWYRSDAEVLPGDTWRLLVRLKRPHGFMNPGGFDYEAWLFQHRIRATGYVRFADENVLVARPASSVSFDRVRYAIKKNLNTLLADSKLAGVIHALTIGDKSQINADQWEVFRRTGTNHLVAISGLHIALVAGFSFFLWRYLWGSSVCLSRIMPAQKSASLFALLMAFCYAGLAGFAIPTQRALVMIAVILGAVFFNRRFLLSQVLAIALLAVLLFDPLSVLSGGFWLSFFAVAMIFYVLSARLGRLTYWRSWFLVQLAITIMLMPLLLLFFQQFSMISPIANFIAIPWLSFVVVPLSLFGAVISLFSLEIAKPFLVFADINMKVLWGILEWLSTRPLHSWVQHTPPLWTVIIAFVGIACLFAPRGFPGRWLAILWLIPLFLAKPDSPQWGEMGFTLLDVGQGLAVIVRTQNHTLVYDTGPKFSAHFNTGEAVVIPYLRYLGIPKINTLMVSHGDSDHRGGVTSILNQLLVDQFLTADLSRFPQHQAQPCRAGQSWDWDGVSFTVLNPEEHRTDQSANDISCVLRVATRSMSLLLTGDIEINSEQQLLKNYPGLIAADVLVVPHHGSKTSSSIEFIDAVSPAIALYSLGYKNRYGFPAAEVKMRYQARNITTYETAKHGAIVLKWDVSSGYRVQLTRAHEKKYWHAL